MKKISCLLAFVLNVLVATGQDEFKSVKEDLKKATENEASSQSALQGAVSRLQLNSALTDKSAQADVGFDLGNMNLRLSLNQDLDEKEDEVELFNRKGLTSGTTFAIDLSKTFWHPTADAVVFDEVRNAYATRHHITNQEEVRALTYAAMYESLTQSERDQLDNAIHWGVPIIFGVNYSISKATYTFTTDTVSFSTTDETKLVHGIEGYIAFVLDKSDVVVLSFGAEGKFKESKKQTVGLPAIGNALFQTKEIKYGEPVFSRSNKVSVEYRRMFLDGDGEPGFAINPILSYDITEEKAGFKLPIYFLRIMEKDKIKGLGGGIVIGYETPTSKLTSLKDGINAGIFVSASFKAFSF